MISAANFETYAKENRLSATLYYYVHLEDAAGNNYYFTDGDVIGSYLPAWIDISPAYYEGDIYSGSFSVRPLTIKISNRSEYTSSNSTQRFSDNFASNEFETELCRVYLGYKGITSTSDLLPVYIGRVYDFNAGALDITFNVTNRFYFELPLIPKNKFDSTGYSKIDKSFLGKPIPLVFGRFNYTPSGSTKFGDKAFVPLYVVENNLSLSSPTLVLECADHAVDAIDKVLIYDEILDTVGEIQDTWTSSLGAARVTISLNTASSINFLEAIFSIYPSRIVDLVGTTNRENTLDNDHSTYATLSGGGDYLTFAMPDMGIFSRDELEPIYSTSGGTETVAIKEIVIEINGYAPTTFKPGDTLAITVGATSGSDIWFSESLNETTVNSLGNVNTFNYTTAALRITDNYKWDGATAAFQLRENSGGSTYNIIPDAGYYWTMEDLAAHIDQKINDAGTLNTYRFSYDSVKNKFKLERAAGSFNFKMASAGRAATLGITGTGSYTTTTYTSENPTMLDVPDGNLSNIRVSVVNNSASTNFRLKAVRVKVHRTYRKYNILDFSGASRPTRRAPGVRTGARGTGPGQSPSSGSTVIRTSSRTGGTSGRTLRTPVGDPLSVRDSIAGARFFATVDGYPTGSTYYKKGPEIVQGILEDYIGITGVVDTTSFSTANTNATTEPGVYVDTETDPMQLFTEIMRYSKGFLHVGQDGKLKATVLKSSYSSGDVADIIYYRDIPEPLTENFRIYRNSVAQVASDMTLNYQYNFATEEYGNNVQKTTTSTLNIAPRTENTTLIYRDEDADTIAEYFAGDGATLGFFGRQRKIVEVTLLAPEYHLLEVGDIVQFDSGFSDLMKIFGTNPNALYFMIFGKRFDKRRITLYLIEVQ
jgi:hypothetical protein